VTERIPLFPLGSVLFPGAVLPLRVFEPRYRQLLADLLERPEARQEFGVVAIREGHEVGADGVRSLFEVGCTARLRLVEPTPDGTIRVVTTGGRRFRLRSLVEGPAYPTAEVDPLPEPVGDCPTTLVDTVAREFLAYRAELAGSAVELPADPGQLSYVVAAALLAPTATLHALLAAPDTGSRLRAEQTLIRQERAIRATLPSVPGLDLTRTPPDPN
jgi:Lon protease-like protein